MTPKNMVLQVLMTDFCMMAVCSDSYGNFRRAPVVTPRPSAPAEFIPNFRKKAFISLQRLLSLPVRKLEEFMQAMNEIGVTGITITNVLGCGVQKGAPAYYRGVEMDMNLLPKVKD